MNKARRLLLAGAMLLVSGDFLSARAGGYQDEAIPAFLPAFAEAPPASWIRLPAEFEPQEALVLPAGLLLDRCPETFFQVVEALRRRTRLIGVVNDPEQQAKVERSLLARKLPRDSLTLIEIPHNTLWIRDYGPIFVKLHEVHRAAVDTDYPDPGRTDDDVLPGRLAAHFQASLLPTRLVFEGGNLLCNGRGLCLTSASAVLRNGDQPDPELALRRSFRRAFGSRNTVILEPLVGEPTGHIDMFACFTAPDEIVVGRFDPATDPVNAAVLDRNAAALAGLRTAAGPLRVVRIPMPPHADGVWRTYTNAILANRVALVPIYPAVDQAGANKALEVFSGLLPGWKIVGIDCSNLIQDGGALRCVSAWVPSATAVETLRAVRPAVPDREDE